MSRNVTNQIWNRAALGGGNSPGRGDSALAALLLFHSLALNGGVHHAVESLSPAELADAANGFAFFGFEEMSGWLASAASDPLLKEWTDENEIAALARYAKLIPDEDHLVARFEAVYQQKTAEFAPVSSARS